MHRLTGINQSKTEKTDPTFDKSSGQGGWVWEYWNKEGRSLGTEERRKREQRIRKNKGRTWCSRKGKKSRTWLRRGCLRILECGIKGFENWGTAEERAVDKETEGVIGDWEREGKKTYRISTNSIPYSDQKWIIEWVGSEEFWGSHGF